MPFGHLPTEVSVEGGVTTKNLIKYIHLSFNILISFNNNLNLNVLII